MSFTQTYQPNINRWHRRLTGRKLWPGGDGLAGRAGYADGLALLEMVSGLPPSDTLSGRENSTSGVPIPFSSHRVASHRAVYPALPHCDAIPTTRTPVGG
jgi:hypothetical protein